MPVGSGKDFPIRPFDGWQVKFKTAVLVRLSLVLGKIVSKGFRNKTRKQRLPGNIIGQINHDV